MKRHSFLVALLAAVLATAGSFAVIRSAGAETKEEPLSSVVIPGKTFPRISQAVKQAVGQALPNTPIDSIRPTGIPGLFEVVAGRNLFYTGASGRYLVFGEIYDLKTATNITAERFQDLRQAADEQRRISWADLPMDAAIHYGDGDLRLAVFSDPECPYCRRLTEALRQTKGIAVSEIMFPIPALHPQAMEKAAGMLCAEDPAEKCLQAAHDKISVAMAFGRRHGIQATPTLVAPDGRVHTGFMPPDEIKSWLMEEKK